MEKLVDKKKLEDKERMEQAMMEFCIRVLAGKGTPQETATLPHILKELREWHGNYYWY